VQVTDNGSGNKNTTVAVNLIPTPGSSTPLSVSLPVNALFFGEGQQNIALPSQAFGGTGPYTYSWQYVPFHNGPAVTLTGANTSHPTFNAPLVDGNTNLGFRVTVTDSASHSVVGGGRRIQFHQGLARGRQRERVADGQPADGAVARSQCAA
jgi:hypothetical protein